MHNLAMAYFGDLAGLEALGGIALLQLGVELRRMNLSSILKYYQVQVSHLKWLITCLNLGELK